MLVRLFGLSGEYHHCPVNCKGTGRNLKLFIEAYVGVLPQEVRLFFNDLELQDDTVLEDIVRKGAPLLDIPNNAIMDVLVLRVPVPPRQQALGKWEEHYSEGHRAHYLYNDETGELTFQPVIEPDDTEDIVRMVDAQDVSALSALLDRGVNVNRQLRMSATALHIASTLGRVPATAELLRRRADVELPDSQGFRALHIASRGGHAAVVRMLLSQQAGVDAMTPDGTTPLMEAGSCGGLDACKVLIEHRADVNVHHGAPLQLAAMWGVTHMAQLLLVHKANPDFRGDRGLAPMHMAATYGWAATLRVLLAGQAEVDPVCHGGSTPLATAAAHGQRESALVLLAARADEEARTRTGFSVLNVAVGRSRLRDAAEDLGRAAGATCRVAWPGADDMASTDACKEVVATLLDHRANMESAANCGLTPLLHAVFWGRTAAVQALLSRRANLEARCPSGATALLIAAEQGQLEAARALLSARAAVEAAMKHGLTALMVATSHGHVALVELLLDTGANKRARDAFGRTAAVLAAVASRQDAFLALSLHGLRPRAEPS